MFCSDQARTDHRWESYSPPRYLYEDWPFRAKMVFVVTRIEFYDETGAHVAIQTAEPSCENEIMSISHVNDVEFSRRITCV